MQAPLHDFASVLPATKGSLPPLDPASLIPVSPDERRNRKPARLSLLTRSAIVVKSN
jgi:hypothetical protein